jgi:hypothetical protein
VEVFPEGFTLVARASALPLDLAAPAFAPGFTAALDATVLAGTCFAVFVEDAWVFAGFFIAFAMGSTTKWVVLVAGKISGNQPITFH